MDAYAFAQVVAVHIDTEVAAARAHQVVVRRKRSLNRIIRESDVSVALVAAFFETLPTERAFPFIPHEPIRSAKAVAARLIVCARLRAEGTEEDRASWPKSDGFADCVRRTFVVFLDALRRGRDAKIRELEHRVRVLEAMNRMETTERRKASARCNAVEFILLRSSVLEIIVWSLFNFKPDERDKKLKQIVEALAESETPLHLCVDQVLGLLAQTRKAMH